MRNEKAKKLVPLILERINKWGDVREIAARGELDFFFKQPEYKKEKLLFKNTPTEKIKILLPKISKMP